MLSVLEKNIKNTILSEFVVTSRVHPLRSFFTHDANCYVKRDDELGLMGSKLRKFSSLLAYLLKEQADEAVVIGSAQSNHVLGISQLLIEKGIKPKLFLCETKQDHLKGNALLTKILVPESQIQWISRNEWPQVYELALNYASQQSRKICVISEGGCQPEALNGALTLPIDILRNERQLGIQFKHVFIDSGTGLMAIALLLGLAFLQHSAHVHVVLMAGTEEEFLKKLKDFHSCFSLSLYNCPFPQHFSLCKPKNAKSFGSTNSQVFQVIKQIAENEGVLCDPIYNAKLFIEAREIITKRQLQGNALIIQSGGTLSLLGFSSHLTK